MSPRLHPTKYLLRIALGLTTWGQANDALAGTLCALVRIKIDQQLTFERQAFDAHMEITNSLPDLALTELEVDLEVADERGGVIRATTNPNDLSALFFVRLDQLTGTQGIAGDGTIAPQATADVRWLLIPAAGAAAQTASGKLYLVGASIKYKINGAAETIDAAPASIFVRPLPLLALDYFIPRNVAGDDPDTQSVEAVEPFSFGVRVQNNGNGAANRVTIDSAQPRIVDNQLGLAVDFRLTGAAVGDQAVEPTLLLNFGTIDPQSAAVGRWTMTSTLSGRFTDFDVRFRHADDLGGAVTALVAATNAHFLIHDVLVDLPQRDRVRDFLAEFGPGYRVYESDNVDSDVTDQSASTTIQLGTRDGDVAIYTVQIPRTAGFMYTKIADPSDGTAEIVSVTRSDGIALAHENSWTSRSYGPGAVSDFGLHLFDSSSSDSYTIRMRPRSASPSAPIFAEIPALVGVESRSFGVLVVATTPNSDSPPQLSTGTLPLGANFRDHGDGTGDLTWTPRPGQAGRYFIRFAATGGGLTTDKSVPLTVNPAGDADGDGLADTWEIEYFGDLTRDGLADSDLDGETDRDEYLAGTNPVADDLPAIPPAPKIDAPSEGELVRSGSPTLAVQTDSETVSQGIVYEFEIFADEALSQRVSSATGVAALAPQTSWQTPETLTENHQYWWRVRAQNNRVRSLWTYGAFVIDAESNDGLTLAPVFPRANATVASAELELAVNAANSPALGTISYQFSIYRDEAKTDLAARSPLIKHGVEDATPQISWVIAPGLPAGEYFWTVQATTGAGSTTMLPPSRFIVDAALRPVRPPVPLGPTINAVVASGESSLQATLSSDSPGDVTFHFELDSDPLFGSPERQEGDVTLSPDGTAAFTPVGLVAGGRYFWRVNARRTGETP